MNALPFVKVQGNGNDFILLDGIAQALPEWDWGALARQWCRRRHHIGGDGLMLALPSTRADFRMRLFNADGSEAEMCGNGIRCLAHFLFTRYAQDEARLRIETGAGIREVFRACPDATLIRVDMGVPHLVRADIPMAGTPPDQPVLEQPLTLPGGREVCLSAVNTGTPHAVLFVEQPLDTFPLEQIGASIERHALFPNRTNVQVARVCQSNRVEVRTWERGVGETLACGTGACAVVVVGVLTGRLETSTTVRMPGGELQIHWEDCHRLWMTGPAQAVFEGRVPVPSTHERMPPETKGKPTASNSV